MRYFCCIALFFVSSPVSARPFEIGIDFSVLSMIDTQHNVLPGIKSERYAAFNAPRSDFIYLRFFPAYKLAIGPHLNISSVWGDRSSWASNIGASAAYYPFGHDLSQAFVEFGCHGIFYDGDHEDTVYRGGIGNQIYGRGLLVWNVKVIYERFVDRKIDELSLILSLGWRK